MNTMKKTSLLSLSITMAGLLLLLLTGSLRAQGLSLTRVTTGATDYQSRYPIISGNGQKIVFVSTADLLGQGNSIYGSEIWLYDIATKNLKRITTVTNDRHCSFPSINHDGSKIAFSSDNNFLGQDNIVDNQFEIWLYDTGTMTFTRATTGSANYDSQNPSISGDGSKIAFVSDADLLNEGIDPSRFEIWLYDTDTMTVTRLTTAIGDGNSYMPSINADGSKIAFFSDNDFLGQGNIADNQFEVWLYDTDTMTVSRITTGTGDRDSEHPSINADGSKIAFYSNADLINHSTIPDRLEIWLYDTTTAALTRITTGSDDGRSSWGPSINGDGSKITFESNSDFLHQGISPVQGEIWLYDTTTAALTRITTGTADRDSSFASISSDGSKVTFYSDADFLNQGNIDEFQDEIWLVEGISSGGNGIRIYIPLMLKNTTP